MSEKLTDIETLQTKVEKHLEIVKRKSTEEGPKEEEK